jgi:formimidoylglutamate deiminase
MTALHFGTALLPEGWRDDVRIEVKDGVIAAVTPDAPLVAGDERYSIGVPGMPNLHSHAFQRGMAGLAEHGAAGPDDFWTWREAMYRVALSVTPDDVEAIAAQLYVEMLEAGFTRVGEFHYLHHDVDGRPYADIAEMGTRIAAAATETGIGLTLLPVFYAHADFGGAPPTEGQRRFICDLDGFGRLFEASQRLVAKLKGGNIGVAPHSLRAVTPAELSAVIPLATDGPIHIHAAEQVREVEACLAWSGKRPIEWLLEHAQVDDRWCLIHSTHMTETETNALAASGAAAGLCPITEGNLGDGIFNGRHFLEAGGPFGIGSDSNVLIDLGAELRQLEYVQRLRDRARNRMVSQGRSTGRTLFEKAIEGGARALAQGPGGLRVGGSADVVSLRPGHIALEGRTGDRILDGWIFAANSPVVDSVWVRPASSPPGCRASFSTSAAPPNRVKALNNKSQIRAKRVLAMAEPAEAR